MNIRRIERVDFKAWLPLWKDYVAYHDVTLPDAVTQSVWARLHDPDIDLFGLVAVDGADIVYGFAHYVIHQNTWNDSSICYLEDMGVAMDRRGGGTGRAMIEYLATLAREQGWGRLYWHAKQDNAPARRLYDTVANLSDYVRYDYRF
jgi:GNAT superfamily N-acetyltransferase